jgi:hypothetical protein
MTQTGLTTRKRRPTSDGMKRVIAIAAMAATGMTGGCVNVTAPDKPIVITLNINVTQAIVYRLDGEAKTAIQQNPGIF